MPNAPAESDPEPVTDAELDARTNAFLKSESGAYADALDAAYARATEPIARYLAARRSGPASQ